MPSSIKVAARTSPLSRAQVDEIFEELRPHHPQVQFAPTFLETMGDRDLLTSLRSMGKTDFFTREIDQLIIAGECDIAIHSAKDLPDPLPEDLTIVAITRGVDSSDSLVLRNNQTIDTLASGAKIATSSKRREDMVKQLRSDLSFIDLRGTIGQRLEKLETGAADGVVIAEAALIRLNLTHLNRVTLPGETVEGQGQLAIVARRDNEAMRQLFCCIDSRVTV